jgi:AhpD family alkylhydroperoxidase
MSKRLEVFKLAPQPYQHLLAIKDYVSAALPAELLELVYLRVSQINHCAFCIDMHTRDLLKLEVGTEKIALLPVWDEAAPCSAQRNVLRWPGPRASPASSRPACRTPCTSKHWPCWANRRWPISPSPSR